MNFRKYPAAKLSMIIVFFIATLILTINLSAQNPAAKSDIKGYVKDAKSGEALLFANALIMTHLGKHRVKVYRVNQEYADLYQSRNQDSRDLNEPLTNIVNGLGVFSAFNSDSVFFELKQQ